MKKKNGFKQLGKLLKDGLSSTDLNKNHKISYYSKKVKKPGADEAFDFIKLIQKWPEVIGVGLSKHTIPLKNTRRSLTILTDHPAYSEQLKFMEVELLKKIKNKFPSLEDSLRTLYFKTDSTYFHKQKLMAEQRAGKNEVQEEKIKKAFHPYSPEFRKLRAQAEIEFKDVESEEIRERLTSIYIQSRQTE